MPNCPGCRTEQLAERVDRTGVVYDVCPKCRGLWLDSGELSQLLGRPAAEGLLDFTQGIRACVRCAKPMLRGGFINPALKVDRCAPCGGIWLDAAELRVVRQLLGVGQATDAEQTAPAVPARAAAPPVAHEPAEEEDSYEEAEAQPHHPVPRFDELPRPQASIHHTGTGSSTAPIESWQMHGGFWLVLGLGTLVYGKMQHAEWRVLTAAGGDAGLAPTQLLGFGAAMAAVGLGFLITQPAHASEGYLWIFRVMVTPRRRRRFGRGSHPWYDSSY